MGLAVILCKTRQKNHTMIDCTTCHSQYHLCDPLGNVTMKTPLDLSVLSPRAFLTTTLLFAAHPDSTFGPGESNVSHIFLLHPMLDGSIFCLLLPCYNIWGTITCGAPALSQEMESRCSPSPVGRLHGSFPGLETSAWQYILYFPHHLLCVSPKAYLRKPLNLIWPEIFLAICELGWVPVYPFHFQDMPTLLICVPGL